MPPRREGHDEGAAASLLRPPLSSSASAAVARSRNNSVTGVAVQAAAIASRNSPYLRGGPMASSSSTSLGSLPVRSTSGDDVVIAGQPVNAVDAPYLSTTEAHLGRMTLTAPDNMRRRKLEEREKRQKARKRKAERAEVASNALMSNGAALLSSSPMAPASTARPRPALVATRSTSNLHALQTLESQRSRSPTRPPRPRSAQNATRSDTSPERRPAAMVAAEISAPAAESASAPRTEQRRVRRRRRRGDERPATGAAGDPQSRRSSEQSAAGVRAEALRRVTQRRRDIYADLPAMGLPGASDSEPDDAPPPFPNYATRPVSPPAMPAEGEEWTEEMRRRQEEYMTNKPPDSPPPAFLSGDEDGTEAARVPQRQAVSSPDQSSDDDETAQEAISEERRLWEEDAAAGFSFEERLERERARRQTKEVEQPTSNDSEEQVPAAVALPNADLGQLVMEARARRNQGLADSPAQSSEPDLPSTATASTLPAVRSAATTRPAAGKRFAKKSSAHRRTVSDVQASSTPRVAPPAEPSTVHRNAAIGSGRGLRKAAAAAPAAGPMTADSSVKVTSLRARPASESHSRFRDDASAAANRRLALWGPKLDEATGSGGGASDSMGSQLYSVTAPATLRSRSTNDVTDRLKGLFDDDDDKERATSAASMRRHETSSSSGPPTHDEHDSSDSEDAWENEDQRFKSLHQKSTGRPVVVDSSDDEAEEGADNMPGGFSAAKRRAEVELPELGKVGSTIPRAPPPLALGRSRGGGAAYSSSESSSESDANRLRDDDESDSDSPPEMDEVVSTGGHDAAAGPPLADKGKQPMRSLHALPLEESSSSRSAWPAGHASVHRAGSFQEDSGSSRDFSDDTDDGDAYVEAHEHAAGRQAAQDTNEPSRSGVQNRLKGLFAAQLSPPQGPSSTSAPTNASRASFGSLFETQLDDVQPRGPSSVEQQSARRPTIESQASGRRTSNLVDEQQARSEALQSISQLQRTHDTLPAGVDRDSLAALERLLARTAPSARPSPNGAEPLVAEPSRLTRSGAIGSRQMASSAFVNPRTMNAPRPLGRLPTITAATRHFPAAQRPSPTSSAADTTGDSAMTARPASMYMLPPPATQDRARPVSQMGTPSWMAYIPTNERHALPTPMEPDRRVEAPPPPPRNPSPTRSVTGSRVNAMVSRFEQHRVGSDVGDQRPPSPLKRTTEEQVDHVPVRRRPPPPPPPSAWSSFRKTSVNAHEMAIPPAATSTFEARRPPDNVYVTAQRRLPDQEASMFATDPTAAGNFYNAPASVPALPPRPRQDVGPYGFATSTMQQPVQHTWAPSAPPPPPQPVRTFASTAAASPLPTPPPPRPAPTEPIAIFGNLYSSEERSRSSGSLFAGSRPLPVPPRVDVAQAARSSRVQPPPMARRPSTPRSFFVDEAAHPVEEEEEQQQPQRVLAVDTSRSDEGDGQSDSRRLQRSDDSAARDPSAIASPTPLPTTLSPQQTLQAGVSDSATTANTAAQPRRAPSLGYTDLDLFASRLADVRTAAPDGEDSGVASGDDTNNRRDTYDDLHLLAEFLGPAKAPGLTQEQMETLPVGRVEVLRRRVVGKRDDGRDKVKLALAVTGVKVERCGVCLVQFKEGNLACVFPCLHVLHEQCAIKLLRDTKVCPICRAPVIVEA